MGLSISLILIETLTKKGNKPRNFQSNTYGQKQKVKVIFSIVKILA